MADDWDEDETDAKAATVRARTPIEFRDTTDKLPDAFGEETELELKLGAGDETAKRQAAVQQQKEVRESAAKIIVGQREESLIPELDEKAVAHAQKRPARRTIAPTKPPPASGTKTAAMIALVVVIGLLGVLIGFGAMMLRR